MSITTHMVTHVATQAALAEQAIVKGLRRAGAVSPETASEVPVDTAMERDCLDSLLLCGKVLEAAPGRYYLAPRRGSSAPAARGLWVLLVVAALLAFLVWAR